MTVKQYRFHAHLWEYEGPTSWFFFTVPDDQSDEIEELTSLTRRGFGSVRVRVTIGATSWNTSVFPDSKRKAYILPVKKQVRTSEGLGAGSAVDVTLELVDPV